MEHSFLPVLETTKPVVETSQQVHIVRAKIPPVCDLLLQQHITPPPWDRVHHFDDGSPRTVQYLLLLDSLNFCFWPAPKWRFTYRGEKLGGYYSLATALKLAVERDPRWLDATFLADVELAELDGTLAGNRSIPLLAERWRIVREVGRVLETHYQGQAVHLVEAAQGSALNLVARLVQHFPNFRDEATYRGQPVGLYKRAQIFVADLHGAFEGQSWGDFHDLDKLTTFADYQVPRVLRDLGILQYEPALAEMIARQRLIHSGSEAEVEIRACTVWAVELMIREFASRGVPMTAVALDWILWNLSKNPAYQASPHHRTLTTFY
ncbi:MAG: hypothetical protein GXP41_06955 [Chloroflexi bacterium]|nr:hypothetical protein [Chloroflexota bacterium]